MFTGISETSASHGQWNTNDPGVKLLTDDAKVKTAQKANNVKHDLGLRPSLQSAATFHI